MDNKNKVGNHNISRKEYHRIHYWLSKNYGKADMCSNKKCSGLSKRYEWALVRGKDYRMNINNYIKLCRKCHAIYDVTSNTRKKLSKALSGRKLPYKTRDRISKSQIKRWSNKEKLGVEQLTIEGKKIKTWGSIKEASENLGVNAPNIHKVINGERNSAYGFCWRRTQALDRAIEIIEESK